MISAIGLTAAAVLLAAWSVAVIAVVVVPAALIAALTTPLITVAAGWAFRGSQRRNTGRRRQPLVIDGAYKVLSPGAGKD